MSKRLDEWLNEVSEAHGLVPPSCLCVGDMACPTCCPHDTTSHGIIPCPDGLAGCLVAHFGERCDACGAINPGDIEGGDDE